MTRDEHETDGLLSRVSVPDAGVESKQNREALLVSNRYCRRSPHLADDLLGMT